MFRTLRLERDNLILLVKGQSDLVESIQKAALFESVDLKHEFIPVRTYHLAIHEVNGELRARDRRVLDELFHLRSRQCNGEHAVVDAVCCKRCRRMTCL